MNEMNIELGPMKSKLNSSSTTISVSIFYNSISLFIPTVSILSESNSDLNKSKFKLFIGMPGNEWNPYTVLKDKKKESWECR